jgi:hypothetical protein
MSYKSRTLQENRRPSYEVCKVGFPVDCLLVNLQICTDITLPQKTEEGPDPVGKIWTCIQGVYGSNPSKGNRLLWFSSVPPDECHDSSLNRIPLPPSKYLAFTIVCAFNSILLLVRGAQIPGARSPRRLTFVRCRLIFVSPEHGPFFMSPF